MLKKFWPLALILMIILIAIFLLLKTKASIEKKSPMQTPPSSVFKLESTFPKKGNSELALPGTVITLVFSLPVSSSEIEVNIDPPTNHRILSDENDQRVIYVKPATLWEYDREYTLFIVGKSRDGTLLTDQPLNLVFKFTKPTSGGISY